MKITKEYKFYYGHRNQELNDKCFRPHGHDAKIFITFNVKRLGNLTTLFGDFDSKVEPWFKEAFDHRFAIDKNDPLLPYLQQFEKDRKEDLGLNILPFATSVENVTFYIFHHLVTVFNFDVDEIKYQETRTSTVIYNKQDYEEDLVFFHKELGLDHNSEDSEFASLYEFLGYAAGSKIGKAVAEQAKKEGIPFNKQSIPSLTGFNEVQIYPVSFLKKYFNKQ